MRGATASPNGVQEKGEEMFLGALSRKADESERVRYAASLRAPPGQGYEDADWTLLNSSGFVRRH